MEYIAAKNIVTKCKDSSWFGLDYMMNIYRGCCHGCIYCDSRSDCYRVKNFDTIKAKEHALTIIRDDLRRKVKTGVVGTGSMSDPYNPFEKELQLSRHAFELIDAFGFGTAVATKSDLIVRDKDIFKSIGEHSPVLLKITITTADDELAGKIEPNAPRPSQRFAAIRELTSAGLFAGILLMPVLPFITDGEEAIREIIRQGKEAGAKFIYPSMGVTLRNNQREYYYDKLQQLFPGQKQTYIKRYGNSYHCGSPKSKSLYEMLAEECQKRGIYYTMNDIILAYKRGYECEQLSFFP